MIVCPGCGRSNEDSALFCGSCGRALAGASSRTLPPPPPPALATTTPVAPPRSPRFRFRLGLRTIVALLLIAVFVLAIAAVATPWWSYSASTGGHSESVSFLPGSNYNVTCAGSCGGFAAGSFPYSAIGGGLGGLYEGILVLVGIAAGVTGLAALLTGLGALGWRIGKSMRFGVYLGSIAAGLLLLGALVWTASGQPGSFPSGSSFSGSGSGATPATSFWGSNGAGTESWGAGAGWYLALASLIVLVVAIVLLMIASRRGAPATPERRTRAAVAPAPVAPRGYTPPPPAVAPSGPNAAGSLVTSSSKAASAPVASEAADAPGTIACPACGTPNLAKARSCSYCQRSLR